MGAHESSYCVRKVAKNARWRSRTPVRTARLARPGRRCHILATQYVDRFGFIAAHADELGRLGPRSHAPRRCEASRQLGLSLPRCAGASVLRPGWNVRKHSGKHRIKRIRSHRVCRVDHWLKTQHVSTSISAPIACRWSFAPRHAGYESSSAGQPAAHSRSADRRSPRRENGGLPAFARRWHRECDTGPGTQKFIHPQGPAAASPWCLARLLERKSGTKPAKSQHLDLQPQVRVASTPDGARDPSDRQLQSSLRDARVDALGRCPVASRHAATCRRGPRASRPCASGRRPLFRGSGEVRL